MILTPDLGFAGGGSHRAAMGSLPSQNSEEASTAGLVSVVCFGMEMLSAEPPMAGS